MSLFAFEVISDDPDLAIAQWEILLTTAVNQRLPLTINRGEDLSPLEVRIELEEAFGGQFPWIAHIRRGAKNVQAPASISMFAKEGGACGLLAESDAIGFFDLDFANDETLYSPAWRKTWWATVTPTWLIPTTRG